MSQVYGLMDFIDRGPMDEAYDMRLTALGQLGVL